MQSRPLMRLMMIFTNENRILSFFICSYIYSLDAALLVQYFSQKMNMERAYILSLLFLFSAAVFYAALPYGISLVESSIVFLLVIVSLLLYDKKKEYALYFQIFTVFYKELIPLMIIAYYFCDGKNSVNEIIKDALKNKIALLVLAVVSLEYISMRVYFTLQNPNSLWSNPFQAGSIYYLFIDRRESYFTILFQFFMIFNITWIFIIELRKRRDLLFLFVVVFVFVFLFGAFWEADKLFVLFPLIGPLFYEAIDELRQWIFKTNHNNTQQS